MFRCFQHGKADKLVSFLCSSGSDRSTASTSTNTTTNRLCSSSGEPSTDFSLDLVDSSNDNPPEQLETRRHSLLERTIVNCEKISDSEKHHLLTTLQADILDSQLDTQFFLISDNRK